MATHEFDSVRAKQVRRAVPPRSNSVRARRSIRSKTRGNSLLAWVFSGSMLVAAAALAAGAYWGYRQMQPRPLFTPASATAEAPAVTGGGASGRPD